MDQLHFLLWNSTNILLLQPHHTGISHMKQKYDIQWR